MVTRELSFGRERVVEKANGLDNGGVRQRLSKNGPRGRAILERLYSLNDSVNLIKVRIERQFVTELKGLLYTCLAQALCALSLYWRART